MFAWGDNGYNQTNVPSGLLNPIAIAAGGWSSLALQSNGIPVQWGSIIYSQSVPSDLTNAISIKFGSGFALALADNGTVRAWGGNDYGQTTVPASLNKVVKIAAGYVHSLALKSDGKVVAWGDNSSGQTNVPSWLSNVVDIAAAEFHNLALRSDGTVVGWGQNYSGESTGTTTYYNTNGVVKINGNILSNVVSIAAGTSSFSLGLKKNGTVAIWGDSYFNRDAATNLSGVVAIAAGSDFCMALKTNGTVVAWGLSFNGATNVPPGLTNIVAIAAGNDHCLALQGSVLPSNISATKDAGGFHAALPTQSGRVFALQFVNSLSVGSWTASPLVAGNGKVVTLTDTNATNSQRFYRVTSW